MTRHVMILTPFGREGAGGIDRIMDTLRVEALRLEPAIRLHFVTTRGRSIAQSPFLMAAAMARIALAKASGRLDLVHVNLAANASAYRKALLARLCRALRVPYVIHLHGADFAAFWIKGERRRRMIDRLFRRASGLILLGTHWRTLVIERLPDVADRIAVAPNAAPVPPEAARPRDPADPTVRVLFLGALGERKGSPDLVKALAAMRPRTRWRAVLAGDGAVAETRAHVAASRLSERVEVPGWVGPAEVIGLLAVADILVLPSRAENLPMSVIEGMAAGLAVVTTPVGATPDIIRDGETGLLVRPGDVTGLATAIERVVDDAALRRRLGDAARAFHRAHLDTPRFVETLAEAWRDAMARGPC